MPNITLTENQAKALVLLSSDAERSAPSLAQQMKVSTRAARYAMESLKKLEIAEPRLVVDLRPLGLVRYHLLFSLAPSGFKNREKAIARIAKADSTLFLAEMGGRFDYQLSVAAKDERSALNELERLSALEIREKALTVRLRQLQLPRRYLTTLAPESNGIETGKGHGPVVLDDIDHQILSLRSGQPDRPLSLIARTLGLPLATARYREERLRAKGIIAGTTMAVDCSRYGAQAYVLILASKGFPSSRGKGIFDFARRNPFCTHVVQCLGAWDFEIGVEVPSYGALQEIVDELARNFGDALSTLEVLPRHRILRYSPYPFGRNPSLPPLPLA
jgi:DNA-binding Lrp family transcriptional regulator